MFSLVFFTVLFAILILSAVIGFFRGFIKSVAGLIEYIASFFIAYTFASPASIFVKKIPFIANMITDVEMPAIDPTASFGQKLLTMVRYITQSGLTNGSNETIKQIANNYVADLLSIFIAFAVIFIVSILLLKLIALLLNKFAQANGIKQLNRLLGLVFGSFIGFLITWIIAQIFTNFALPILSVNYPDVIDADMGKTIFMKLFTTYNPISLLMNALLKIN